VGRKRSQPHTAENGRVGHQNADVEEGRHAILLFAGGVTFMFFCMVFVFLMTVKVVHNGMFF